MTKSREERVTTFVVQSLSRDRRGNARMDDPLPARSEPHARRLAAKLAASKIGVVAFSRTGNPKLGDFDDPVVLARYGTMPFDVEDLAAA